MVRNMNDTRNEEEIRLDIGKILKALVRNRLRILIAAAVGTAAAFLLALLITPQYKSSVTFYVRNNVAGTSGSSISSADIAAAKELVASYLVILQSDETLESVIYYAQANRTVTELREMISAAKVDSTEFFRVEVTSTDPWEAEAIANAVGDVLPLRIAGIMENASVRIVDAALVSLDPTDPGYGKLTAAGFAAGALLAVMSTVVLAVVEKTIRSPRDVAKVSDVSVLARISRRDTVTSRSFRGLAAKLRFSFPEDGTARIIGFAPLSSAERESRTVQHLAGTLKRRGNRVLLVECGVPSERGERKTPGLSDFLAEKATLEQIIRPGTAEGEPVGVARIFSGSCRNDVGELLLSPRMTAALRAFRSLSDYTLLELPPLGEVSEAAELARETDGVILTIRQDKSRTDELQNALEQLETANANLLGIVFITNDTIS